MSNQMLRKPPIQRFSLFLSAAVLTALLTGCGGGGGGSSSGTITPPAIGNSQLAVVTGRVVDTSGNPVSGAGILVMGTTLQGSTASDGTFTITNVPLTATQIEVASPNTTQYYNYGTYNGQLYQFGTNTSACPIMLPKLVPAATATTVLPSNIALYPSGNGAPPPPPLIGGCP